MSEHIANNAAPVRIHLVEPQPDMRKEGLKRLAETSDCPRIVVANGTSSVTPFPDQYADAIVMANAAHWFLSDYDIGLTQNVIASLRRRRGNPVFLVGTFLDCFAALAMTSVMRKSYDNTLRGFKKTKK